MELVAPEQLKTVPAAKQWESIKKIVLRVAQWTSEDFAIKQFSENYDPATAIHKLELLIRGEPSLEYQFEMFQSRVWGSGSAETSIVLSLIFPDKYGMWTKSSRMGLDKLGFRHKVPVDKRDISGRDYGLFNKILFEIQNELKGSGIDHSLMEQRVFLDFSGKVSL
jgi:hypothetical protein